jgi:hypothetical protein
MLKGVQLANPLSFIVHEGTIGPYISFNKCEVVLLNKLQGWKL